MTNRPASDEVCRWVSYRITDGEISWIYILNFKPNGRLDWIYDDRHDAKEDDPKFRSAIKIAAAEAASEMKAKGTYDKIGAIREFWNLEQQKLKAKGIDWRTPAELNPDEVLD
jgi:hypothetical protein